VACCFHWERLSRAGRPVAQGGDLFLVKTSPVLAIDVMGERLGYTYLCRGCDVNPDLGLPSGKREPLADRDNVRLPVGRRADEPSVFAGQVEIV
jgi:hypothetical protein